MTAQTAAVQTAGQSAVKNMAIAKAINESLRKALETP